MASLVLLFMIKCCCRFLLFPVYLLQSESKLYNGSDKDVSASGNKLTKKESLKVSSLSSGTKKKTTTQAA